MSIEAIANSYGFDSLSRMGAAVNMGDEVRLSGNPNDANYHKQQLPTIEYYVDKYLQNEGRQLTKYLSRNNKKPVPIIGKGSADLGTDTLAAILRTDHYGVLLGNRDFMQRVDYFSRSNNMDKKQAMRYIWDHELIHASGVNDEKSVEGVLHRYYNHLASKLNSEGKHEEAKTYLQLASVAAKRANHYNNKGDERYSRNACSSRSSYSKAA